MIKHRYSVGNKAPARLNIVVEIPATDALTQKREIDLSDGRMIDAGEVHPPIPIYWHYGCIPQTLDDKGEAMDVILMMDEACVRVGNEIEVRPIGVARITDGWETRGDKIIAVRNTKQHALIREIDDLPPVTTVDGKRFKKVSLCTADERLGQRTYFSIVSAYFYPAAEALWRNAFP